MLYGKKFRRLSLSYTGAGNPHQTEFAPGIPQPRQFHQNIHTTRKWKLRMEFLLTQVPNCHVNELVITTTGLNPVIAFCIFDMFWKRNATHKYNKNCQLFSKLSIKFEWHKYCGLDIIQGSSDICRLLHKPNFVAVGLSMVSQVRGMAFNWLVSTLVRLVILNIDWEISYTAFILGKIPVAQIPQCNNPISHDTPFVTEMCTCVHISLTEWCTVGYLCDA